jgi:hypothetical protein
MTIDKIIKPFIDENIYIYYVLPYLSNMYLTNNEKQEYLFKKIILEKINKIFKKNNIIEIKNDNIINISNNSGYRDDEDNIDIDIKNNKLILKLYLLKREYNNICNKKIIKKYLKKTKSYFKFYYEEYENYLYIENQLFF